MAYAIKYQSEFDNVAENRYRVEILKKDYTGPEYPIFFSGTPVKHNWQTDEPKAPIKGSSLTVGLLTNEISTELIYNINSLYLDDSGGPHILIADDDFIPVVDEPFTISGHPDSLANGTWTPISVTDLGGGNWDAELAPGAFTGSTSPSPAVITITTVFTISILDFYSEEDDTFKCKFYEEGQLKFEGFLVQDDCNELMADFVHEITLSFNDNLGLLKDVVLNANIPDFGGWLVTVQLESTGNIIYIWDSGYLPQIGVPFTITNHIDPAVNGTWTPTAVNNFLNAVGNGYMAVTVASVPSDSVAYGARITGAGSMDFYARNSLLNIIAVCMFNTGLELDTFIYANLFETSHDTDDSFLAQTYIDTKTFLSGDSFDNCYNVLTNILDRFNLTLCQCNGRWNIVRWDEIRYDANVPYFQYDIGFNLIGTGTLNAEFTTGFQQDVYPEAGLTRSIFRPFKFDKETFNYRQPESFINNASLLLLGAYDTTTTDATYTYDWYEFPVSSKWQHIYSDTSQIVVKTNTVLNKEEERYVYQPKSGLNTGGGYVDYTNVEFNDVQVSAGDIMDFTIKIKCASNTGGDAVIYKFGFYLQESESSYWILNNNGGGVGGTQFIWQHFAVSPIQGIGINYLVLAGDAETYLDYTLHEQGSQLRVPKFPVDAALRIRIYGTNSPSGSQPNVDAIWKEAKLTILQYINDSTKVIGHTHNYQQDKVIKNNENTEISMDDAPRSTIAGTLYRSAYSWLVFQRTVEWYRLSNPSELLRIGEITTLEQLFWRRKPRTKLEGTFYGVFGVSMLAVLKNIAFNEFNFIFGSLDIDYKNNNLNCTMWEVFEDGEDDSDLTADYTFTYLYDTK